MLPEFDETKYYLGQLCKNGHDYNGTGKSFRRINNRSCLLCNRARASNYLKTEKGRAKRKEYKRSEKYRQYEAEYRRKNPERVKARIQRYKQKDETKERIKAYTKTERFKENQRRYRQSEKGIETRRRYSQEYNQRPDVQEAKRRYAEKPDVQAQRKIYFEQYRKTESRRIVLRRYYLSEHGRRNILLNTRKRRARKQLAPSSGYTSKQLQNHFAQFNDCCVYCGSTTRISVDHFLPIAHGGSDCLSNIVPACLHCNQSKGDRDVFDWFKQQPTYSQQKWREILRLLGKSEDNYNQIPLL